MGRRKAGYVNCGVCSKVVAGYRTAMSDSIDPPRTLRAFRHGQHRPDNYSYQLHCVGSSRPHPVLEPAVKGTPDDRP
jgi:hypothetical protein